MCLNFFGQIRAVPDYGTCYGKSGISPQQQKVFFGKQAQSPPCQRIGANTATERAALSGMKILSRV